MGDVSTHGQISAAVIPIVNAPEAPLFEIGNWLTDVSQFRDPFAHLSGKKTIFLKGLNSFATVPRLFHIGDLFLGIDNYLDDLMGAPPQTRATGTRPGANPAVDRPDDGGLARWFRAMTLVLTVNPATTPVLKDRPALLGVPKSDIKGVFDALYTQYFPHEHLDFPPFPPDKPQRGVRDNSTVLTPGGAARLTYAYTDTQLQYVADLLTRIERDWAHTAGGDPATRRELVARLGHASHAVEDWFFHSNFVELAWAIANPGQLAPHAPLTTPDPGELESVGPAPTENTLQRRFHRRSRKPAFQGDSDDLSTDTSNPADRIYTGSFGSNDIFFTLIDALGHVFGPTPQVGPDPRSLLSATLHNLLFGTEQERADALKTWQDGVRSGATVAAARVAVLAGRMEQFEADAIAEMCAIEKKLLEDYSVIGLGVVGLLQELIQTGRGVVKASLEAGAAIDTDAAHATNDDRSDNGAPGENIGSHSLMSKDSVRKEPLRAGALNLATYVATYVARTMVSRTPAQSPAQPQDFVDWLELLRYFLIHPAQAAGGTGTEWWRAPLVSIDPRPPEGHTVVLRSLADLPADPGESHLPATELGYYDAALYAERQFTSAVDVAMVLDSIYTGVLTGGIAGMIAGGVAAPSGAGEKVGGVALGLLTGAAVAGASGALGAGVGLLISRRAGVAIGSYTGIAGGTVAAVFAAAAVGAAL